MKKKEKRKKQTKNKQTNKTMGKNDIYQSRLTNTFLRVSKLHSQYVKSFWNLQETKKLTGQTKWNVNFKKKS